MSIREYPGHIFAGGRYWSVELVKEKSAQLKQVKDHIKEERIQVALGTHPSSVLHTLEHEVRFLKNVYPFLRD